MYLQLHAHIQFVDAGALNCGFGDYEDNGPECSACSAGFTLEDYICISEYQLYVDTSRTGYILAKYSFVVCLLVLSHDCKQK